jgi:hypothetical protein
MRKRQRGSLCAEGQRKDVEETERELEQPWREPNERRKKHPGRETG